MAFGAVPGFNYKNISATTLLKTGDGIMGGIFVSAASSTPTITIYDNTAGSGTKIVDTFTPVAATWYPMPFQFITGLEVVISGTVSATVAWT